MKPKLTKQIKQVRKQVELQRVKKAFQKTLVKHAAWYPENDRYEISHAWIDELATHMHRYLQATKRGAK